MKRSFAAALICLLLCACAPKTLPEGDPCDFLVNAKWEGNDSQCVNVIEFEKDGSFSNWCYCGSPVGSGDVSETYRYDKSSKTFRLYDGENDPVDTGKLLYCDDYYLIVHLWGHAFVYENMNTNRPKAHPQALEYTGTEDLSKPCLTVLDFDGKELTVSSHDHDGDAAQNYTVWKLKAAESITFTSVTVTDRSGEVTVEQAALTPEQIDRIGEDYTCGYFEIDRDGNVFSVVFYGEVSVTD